MPDLSKINELVANINKILRSLQEIQNDYITSINKIIDEMEKVLLESKNHSVEWKQTKLDKFTEKANKIIDKFNKKIQGYTEDITKRYDKLVYNIKLNAVTMASAAFGINLGEDAKKVAANAIPTPELPIPEFKIELPEFDFDTDIDITLPRIPYIEIPLISKDDVQTINVGDNIKEMYKTSVFDLTEPELPEDVLSALNSKDSEPPGYSISDIIAGVNSAGVSKAEKDVITTDSNSSGSPLPPGTKNGKYVILDHGHGENTEGKRSPDGNFREYKWNREIVNMLIPALEAKGYTVYTVYHNEQKDRGLQVRRKAVEEYGKKIKTTLKNKDCVFVSVHGNAGGSGKKWMKARGWSVYTYAPKNETTGEFDRSLRSDKYKTFFKMSDNFAQIMVDTARAMGFKTHGNSKTNHVGYFTVIDPKYGAANIPSVLTENFFYDNKEDLAFMTSAEGKKKIVELHVKAIDKYFFGK